MGFWNRAARNKADEPKAKTFDMAGVFQVVIFVDADSSLTGDGLKGLPHAILESGGTSVEAAQEAGCRVAVAQVPSLRETLTPEWLAEFAKENSAARGAVAIDQIPMGPDLVVTLWRSAGDQTVIPPLRTILYGPGLRTLTAGLEAAGGQREKLLATFAGASDTRIVLDETATIAGLPALPDRADYKLVFVTACTKPKDELNRIVDQARKYVGSPASLDGALGIATAGIQHVIWMTSLYAVDRDQIVVAGREVEAALDRCGITVN